MQIHGAMAAMNCLPNDLQQSFAQQELQKTATTAALLDPDKPETLQDHDAARAAYAAVGFRMLMDAGWHPGVRNANGYTVIDLIEAGLNKYQAGVFPLDRHLSACQLTALNGQAIVCFMCSGW
jgi:hypothetical protein